MVYEPALFLFVVLILIIILLSRVDAELVGRDHDIVAVIGSTIPASNPPPAAATLSAPTLSGGQFQFTVTGSAGSNYVVQASTNLNASNWQSLQTNSSPFGFADTNSSLYPHRFYRALATPQRVY